VLSRFFKKYSLLLQRRCLH